MADYWWTNKVDRPYVLVCLTERQWDIVRDACYQRKTKQAVAMAQRIWDQGGGTAQSDGDVSA
jgi:hypothetical protein